MSLFKSVVGAVAPIVGGFFGGPVGAALGSAVGSAINRPRTTSAFVGDMDYGTTMPTSFPGGSMIPAMGSLPAIGAAAGTVARVGMIGARAAMRGAITWCRRNPAWCANAGGTAAIAAMIQNGQLPTPRRRRGRGLSGRDLRGFRRTVRLIRATAGSVGLRGRTRGRVGASSTLIAQN